MPVTRHDLACHGCAFPFFFASVHFPLALLAASQRAFGTARRVALALALTVAGAACSGAKPRIEVARPAPPRGHRKAQRRLDARRDAPHTRGRTDRSLVRRGPRATPPYPKSPRPAPTGAEEQTGATARVLPDGTELSLLCDARSRGVAPCVAQLARAFALPTPSARDTERLRARLRQARVRVHVDNGREADELAFGALFGSEAPRLFPFGLEADDAKVDAGSLQRFSAEQYLSSRALLIAAGDASEAAT